MANFYIIKARSEATFHDFVKISKKNQVLDLFATFKEPFAATCGASGEWIGQRCFRMNLRSQSSVPKINTIDRNGIYHLNKAPQL